MQDDAQQIIDSFTSGVIAVDADGAVVTANRTACEHLHTKGDQLHPGVRLDNLPFLGPLADVFHEVSRTQAPLLRKEIALKLPDGERKEIGLSASLLEGPDPFNGVIFLFIDMTERRRLERAAELNRQLAALGELTTGVVHELRNPVSVISGMAELLMRKLDQDDDRRKTADAIFREAAHIERSISQFLGFAHPFQLSPARRHPQKIGERAFLLCQRRAETKSVELSLACDDGVPEMSADLELVAQALANIINNAIDAVPQDGTVALHISSDLDESGDGEIVFEITDNGPGIHLEEGESLFTPFFTKKEAGTGLGLTIVHRTVAAHRGSVRYANRLEGGAQFVVRLPIDPSLHLDAPSLER